MGSTEGNTRGSNDECQEGEQNVIGRPEGSISSARFDNTHLSFSKRDLTCQCCDHSKEFQIAILEFHERTCN